MILYLLLGAVLAVIYIQCVFGMNHKTGDKVEISGDFGGILQDGHLIINGWHIHHWLFFLVIFFIFSNYYFVTKYKNLSIGILGFSFAMIIHGLMFEDCFVIW